MGVWWLCFIHYWSFTWSIWTKNRYLGLVQRVATNGIIPWPFGSQPYENLTPRICIGLIYYLMMAYKTDQIFHPLYNEMQCPFTDISVFLSTSDSVHTMGANRTESTPSIQNWKLCMSCPVKVDTGVQKKKPNKKRHYAVKILIYEFICFWLSMCICLNSVSHD